MENHSADIGKLVEELIQKHQAEADDLTLSEKAKYGDSSTVSTYTWVHSMKAMSQKFVRDLMDIQTALDEQPTISPDEVRGVVCGVVKCKDCTFGESATDGDGNPCVLCGNSMVFDYPYAHDPDWFCADGEMKGAEDGTTD